MRAILLTCFLALTYFHLGARSIPTPTQTDQIILDNDTSDKADPNDKIRFWRPVSPAAVGTCNRGQVLQPGLAGYIGNPNAF